MSVLCLALLLCACTAATFAVEPEYLDSLLKEKKYEEFAEIMGIENVDLVKPGSASDPMFNKGLFSGDILLTSDQSEQAKQGILFDKYPGSKWSSGSIPYAISRDFSSSQRKIITDAVSRWNQQVKCVQVVPRTSQKDYVYVFAGDGCYSYMGRTGGQQALSLQRNGCLYQNTILHEFDHAAGFAHEHNRLDRDDYINILWDNIPAEWQDQYEKTDSRYFGLQDGYDYYSIMHYPMEAPGTNKPAFEIKQNGIDETRIGKGKDFTQIDLNKLSMQYC